MTTALFTKASGESPPYSPVRPRLAALKSVIRVDLRQAMNIKLRQRMSNNSVDDNASD
jgi:hypothetical protein